MRADVARVIAGVVAAADEKEDEKNPEPGVWQTDENDLPKIPWAQKRAFRTKRGAHNKLILVKRDRDGMTTEYTTDPGDATKIAHDITRKAKELAKAMRARKAGKVRRPRPDEQPFASI